MIPEISDGLEPEQEFKNPDLALAVLPALNLPCLKTRIDETSLMKPLQELALPSPASIPAIHKNEEHASFAKVGCANRQVKTRSNILFIKSL